ncbi:glycosyltransferase family 2 protein [Haladaptatus caseinilyticus]|uniref:glycosyltransferase family 2 protein n=1 Tax=Haladaptatus caseinilyticus TaxID=2993314 RepID=UPI00224A8C7A|nr:glycosyltransferase family A protein [Haladaptatus caseinilyticus]
MIRKPYTSTEPRVSVVIPTLPTHDHEKVITTLRNQTMRAFEVILVDDATLDICEARNAGIEAACADVIALTDDDCRPPPDWVTKIDQAFSDDVVCVEGSVEGGRTYRGEGLYVGCNLAFDRDTALSAGGFRNEYAGWRDDTEFGWRMEAYGPCRYDPNLVMYHPDRPRATIDERKEARLRREYPSHYEKRIVPHSTVGRVNDWLWRRGVWAAVDRVRYAGGGR